MHATLLLDVVNCRQETNSQEQKAIVAYALQTLAVAASGDEKELMNVISFSDY
jgi:hypothetical protein